MTHHDKLNNILYILLDNQRKTQINARLNFEFICSSVCEVNQEWEMIYLKNILINDDYITNFLSLSELPKITHSGIKFIQNGGYTEDSRNRELDKEIKIETLKNLKRSKVAITISLISLFTTIILGFLNIWTSNQLENKKEEFKLLQERINKLENLLTQTL